MIINLAAPNTDTGSLLTVNATESPTAVAMTESPVDVGMTGSPAAVAVEIDPVPTTERPMVVGATESPAAVDEYSMSLVSTDVSTANMSLLLGGSAQKM
jgi:hypothetical protein